ncbi:MAG: ABC transporter permease subunit [Ruminiclostridium sp.]|nr:ABC transporter permease subunit [Ruminiclostridium sp.]
MMTIALATFREVIRKKVILVIGSLTVLYLILFSLMIHFAMEDMRKSLAGSVEIVTAAAGLISIIGFYFSSMIVAFVTIMASVGTISSDIESGLIHSIVSKPIRRREYVLGKYLGISGLSIGYSAVLYVFLMIINFLFDIPPLNQIQLPVFMQGLVLFCYEPLVLISICLFGSVVLKTMNNGILAIGIYILGMIGSMMEQIGTMIELNGLVQWGIVISLISPFDSIYRKMMSVVYSSMNLIGTSFAGPFFISQKVPSIWMMLYSLVFCLGFILLAIRKFNTKDIS